MTELTSLIWVLALGFGAGVLHAFDADHLAAVAGVSGRDDKRSVRFAMHWGLGHGLAVMIIAAVVLLGGAQVPERFSAAAESLVAWMLIAIGMTTFYHLWRQHWCNAPTESAPRQTIVVGLIHGSAGSAPLLAVIPVLGYASPLLGMLHVLLFNVGLLLAMMVVGAAISRGMSGVAGRSHKVHLSFQAAMAMFASGFGIFLLSAG